MFEWEELWWIGQAACSRARLSHELARWREKRGRTTPVVVGVPWAGCLAESIAAGGDGIGEMIFFEAVAGAAAAVAVGAGPFEAEILADFVQHFQGAGFALHGEGGDEQVVANQIDDAGDAASAFVDFFSSSDEKIV